MIVAGIDFSSYTIDVVRVCLDDALPPEWHRFDLSGQDAFDRSRVIPETVPGRGSVFWDDVLAVGIEQPQMRGSSMAAAYSHYRVQGAVLACIPAATLVQPWLPSSWRKAVGLPGNAKKDAVRLHVHDDLRADPFWSQDACDAYCIAIATRSAITLGAAA